MEAKQANQGAAKKPFSEGIQYDKERVCYYLWASSDNVLSATNFFSSSRMTRIRTRASFISRRRKIRRRSELNGLRAE